MSSLIVAPDPAIDRAALIRCIPHGGRCQCGEPAVVVYRGGMVPADYRGNRATKTMPPGPSFGWPRCGFCPGTRRAQGLWIKAGPLEDLYRPLLKLLGDEDAFIAAVRLGYRPQSYGDSGIHIDGEVDIDITLWESL